MHKVDTTSYPTKATGDLDGIQEAIRNQSQQLNQALDLLGQMKQELLHEQSKTQTLQLQMEKVYTYINEGKGR